MQLRVGYELIYECPQPTPMMLMVNIHHSRAGDIVVPDHLTTTPALPFKSYRDAFGNWCTRIVVPSGRTRLSATAIVNDSGLPESVALSDRQGTVQDLPEDCLLFLLGSRYCETDRLTDVAWSLFDKASRGTRQVQAICDYVHQHVTFGYADARPTKTAWEVFTEQKGVCRDFAHLAITLCRCMNIPARYCTGYLGDVGLPPPYAPMDFAAWFEAYVDGQWHTFDPRNNVPRIGRVLIARGRDATDVAISNAFGPNTLTGFTVWTDEVSGHQPS